MGVIMIVIYNVIENIWWIVGVLLFFSKCQVVDVLINIVLFKNVVMDICNR